jgi:MFS family permease
MRLPAAKFLLAASLVSQLPSGMVSLALLLSIVNVHGSYSAGGAVVGAYVIMSGAFAPWWGRRTDRHGAWPVLAGTGLAHLLAFSVLVVALTRHAPLWFLTTATLVAGAVRPVSPGVAQSLWAHLAPDDTIRNSAYALHSLQVGLVWILGPLVTSAFVGIFGTGTGPPTALGMAGVLATTGAFLVGRIWRGVHPERTRSAERKPEPRPGHRIDDSLYTRPYVSVLGSIALYELAVGAAFVTIGIFTQRTGATGMFGVLIALWFCGSTVGGIWFGGRQVSGPLAKRYRWWLTAFAASWAICALVTTPWQLATALLLGGIAMSPTAIAQYNLVAELAPPAARNEGFTWLSTTTGAGGALGTALAGPAIEYTDWQAAGFVLAALALAMAVLVVSPPLSRLRR